MHWSRSTGLQVVQVTIGALDCRSAILRAESAQFSAEQWGVVMEDEVADHKIKTFQLHVGIEREDRCMGEGLQASKLFKAP